MLVRQIRLFSVLVLVASVAGCDCGDTFTQLGNTTLIINTPENGADYGAGQTVAFKATGNNPTGLTRLSLYAGTPTTVACKSPADCATGLTCDEASVCIPAGLNTCTGATGAPTITCSASLAVDQNPALIVNGAITLTAIVVDQKKAVEQKSVTVYIKPLSITFTQPTLTPGTTPAVADVSGSSPVAVAISSAIPLANVVVTYDSGKPLAQWGPNPTGFAFQQNVIWEQTMGVGVHHLLATATDSAGNTATATLDVQIGAALTISFTAPTITAGTTPPVADVAGSSPVAVAVTNVLPLQQIVVTSETGVMVAQWANDPTGAAFSQVVNWNATLGAGAHTLTASATDTAGETATATLAIEIALPTIVFTQPMIMAGTTPPIANVAGSSPVAVLVTSALPLQSVVITYDMGMPLASWTTNVSGTAFQQLVNWNMTVGVGVHTLTATATDTANEVATATMTVQVGLPTIIFTQPVVTPGTNPPLALVAGSSPVAVAVTGPLAFSSVVITYDGGNSLASWGNPTGSSFSKTVDWSVTMGPGTHLLTATATDIAMNVATATLTVQVGVPTIVFTQPMITAGTSPAVADVFGSSPVAVQVMSPVALSNVTITYDGGNALAAWPVPGVSTTFQQTIAWAATMGVGPHTLTATATDQSAQVATATLDVVVQVPSIVFTLPAITAGTNPAVADVSGTSPVAVQVTTPVALSSVIITYETGSTLVSWPSPTTTALSSSITWATAPGTGQHVLTATALCTDGETAQATLTVVVAVPPCTTDANCPTGDRCCTTDGLCHPTVTTGTVCDCAHPCEASEACLPGICGATPSVCRVGCFPGSDSPAPWGTAPAACAAVNGVPAYCNPLPAAQVTTANQGGACSVGDNCDPITQTGCTGLPLDRTKPVSTTNPVVPYNCIPFAPNAYGCVPAGTIAQYGTGCNGGITPGASGTQCGVTAKNCEAGLICVQVVESNGEACTPPTCEEQCSVSTTNPNNDTGCTPGYYCDATYGLGQVYYSTSSCSNKDACE